MVFYIKLGRKIGVPQSLIFLLTDKEYMDRIEEGVNFLSN